MSRLYDLDSILCLEYFFVKHYEDKTNVIYKSAISEKCWLQLSIADQDDYILKELYPEEAEKIKRGGHKPLFIRARRGGLTLSDIKRLCMSQCVRVTFSRATNTKIKIKYITTKLIGQDLKSSRARELKTKIQKLLALENSSVEEHLKAVEEWQSLNKIDRKTMENSQYRRLKSLEDQIQHYILDTEAALKLSSELNKTIEEYKKLVSNSGYCNDN